MLPTGWSKIKGAAMYAGVSERTFRPWLKQGLRYIRLPSGTILTKFGWIDEFLKQFEVDADQTGRQIDMLTNEILSDLN